MTIASALYFGDVLHQRLRPRRHRLRYRVFSIFVDLDELPELDRRNRLFSCNRFNLFSFFESDHGAGNNTGLRDWAEAQLARAGISLEGGAIRLLCFPRVLGYVFNPLSIYFCYARDGVLEAVIYEVRNTFGQHHCYLIPVEPRGTRSVHQACAKEFYVSPFNRVAGRYRFSLKPPDGTLAVVINQDDEDGPLLNAWLSGRRMPFDDRALAAAFVRYPLMTLKVIAGIHWEALRLWLKGMRMVRRPEPPVETVTVVKPSGQ